MISTGSASPRVSVVVFARDAAESIEACLRSLEGQERLEEAEVLVADGSLDRTPAIVRERFPWVRHLRLPPGNMPALKAAAIREARGEVIAILDPWDAAGPGWICAIIHALERLGVADPSAAAVGGAVELDGPHTAANVAAYLFEYGAFVPPLPSGPTDGDMPGNNVAYRRAWLVTTCGDLLAGGFWKPFFHDRIRERSGSLHLFPAMRVLHRTRYQFIPFAVRCFRYGRCFGAMRLVRSPLPRRLLFIVFSPGLPLLLFFRHARRSLGHPVTRRLYPRAALALLGYCTAWGVGEWLGYWFGAGGSCDKVF